MRMHIRRFTRLTNAFSKKLENHIHAIALYFMWHNFGRIHQTLRCTPAVRAGVSDHVWSTEEISAYSILRKLVQTEPLSRLMEYCCAWLAALK
jgi:hypothetical protein